jgi:hypothetical protein
LLAFGYGVNQTAIGGVQEFRSSEFGVQGEEEERRIVFINDQSPITNQTGLLW